MASVFLFNFQHSHYSSLSILLTLHQYFLFYLGHKFVDGRNALDAQLRTILENVKLLYLLEREGGWDTNQNWEDILSLGEQQRLGMVMPIAVISP